MKYFPILHHLSFSFGNKPCVCWPAYIFFFQPLNKPLPKNIEQRHLKMAGCVVFWGFQYNIMRRWITIDYMCRDLHVPSLLYPSVAGCVADNLAKKSDNPLSNPTSQKYFKIENHCPESFIKNVYAILPPRPRPLITTLRTVLRILGFLKLSAYRNFTKKWTGHLVSYSTVRCTPGNLWRLANLRCSTDVQRNAPMEYLILLLVKTSGYFLFFWELLIWWTHFFQ